METFLAISNILVLLLYYLSLPRLGHYSRATINSYTEKELTPNKESNKSKSYGSLSSGFALVCFLFLMYYFGVSLIVKNVGLSILVEIIWILINIFWNNKLMQKTNFKNLISGGVGCGFYLIRLIGFVTLSYQISVYFTS